MTGALDRIDGVAAELADAICDVLPAPGPSAARLPGPGPRANAAFARGLGHYWTRQSGAAVSAFMQALDMDSSHASARYWLARTYGELGRYEEALVELSRLRALSSGTDRRGSELDAVYRNALSSTGRVRAERILNLHERTGLTTSDWALPRLPEWRMYDK